MQGVRLLWERWSGPYILQRLGWAFLTVFTIVVVNFIVVRVVPGDPLTAIVGDYPAPPDYVDQLKRELGLDDSILVQLWRYFVALAQGNLGFSFVNRQPVLDLVVNRSMYTLMLMIPALVLSTLIGLTLAVFTAPRAGSSADNAVTALSLFGFSIPVFWLGQILIVIFAVSLAWLPAQGFQSIRGAGAGSLRDILWHLVLPLTCITTYLVAVVSRVARASVIDSLNRDFILTAAGKGLSERRILWRHVVPNALIPVITVVGYTFGHSLTGAILTETVFSWPGLGDLFLQSVINRDYAVLQGVFLFTSTFVVVANLITDLLYIVVDPRIRLGQVSHG